MKIIDIMTAGIILVVVGVIFFFIFFRINNKHSIMGGRFNGHFKNMHGEDWLELSSFLSGKDNLRVIINSLC